MAHDRVPGDSVMTISALRSEPTVWDPGGNTETGRSLGITIANAVTDANDVMPTDSRTELDSHANMVVIGCHAYILSTSDKMVEVNAFTPEHATIKASLVDAALQYDSPYDGKSYILIIRNGIHVPSMVNNLIPPFLMREAGVVVNDKPKIHTEDPTVNDHALIFGETGFRIPLSIHSIFSFFQTTKPTTKELQAGHDVYILTPEGWNPYTDAYSLNEASMLDWEGNMCERGEWTNKIVLDEVDSDMDGSHFTISTIEGRKIDEVCKENKQTIAEMGEERRVPKECDQVATVLGEISSVLDALTLDSLLRRRADLARDEGTIGATTTIEQEFLLGNENNDDFDDGSEERSEGDESEAIGDVYETTIPGAGTDELDLDQVFAAGVKAITQGKANAKHLAKIWRISYDDTTRTIDAMSQHSVRSEDPTLSQNYGTNDCMLRYRRIKDYFFMDTFFAMSKGGKSSRGNTCCQLFVMDKGFLYVVPMKRKSEVMQAVKQFAKEVGAPDAIVCNMASEQTSAEVKQFCNTIGTTL